MFAVHHRLMSPRLRFVRLGVPGWSGRLRVAHLAGLCSEDVVSYEGAAQAMDLLQEAEPDLVVITGPVLGREDQVVGLLAGVEVPVVAAIGRRTPPELLRAMRRAGVGIPPCGRIRLETLTLGLTADSAAAPLLWARGASLVLAGSGEPLGARAAWCAQARDPHPGQLFVNPGPIQREVVILDLRGGPVREPVERPWDFAA